MYTYWTRVMKNIYDNNTDKTIISTNTFNYVTRSKSLIARTSIYIYYLYAYVWRDDTRIMYDNCEFSISVWSRISNTVCSQTRQVIRKKNTKILPFFASLVCNSCVVPCLSAATCTVTVTALATAPNFIAVLSSTAVPRFLPSPSPPERAPSDIFHSPCELDPCARGTAVAGREVCVCVCVCNLLGACTPWKSKSIVENK